MSGRPFKKGRPFAFEGGTTMADDKHEPHHTSAERQADALAHDQIDGEANVQEGLTEAQLKEIEEKFDSEVRFRPLSPALSWFAAGALFVLAVYHTYTAGFGIPLVGALRVERADVVALQEGEHLERGQPLRRRRQLDDLAAPIGVADRRHPFAFMGGQIV